MRDAVDYDLLVAIPPNFGAKFLEGSGLEDPLRFVETDNFTLKFKNADNIYVVGDATNVPASKAGAVALLGLAKKLSDPSAANFLEKIADLPSKVDLAGAKPVGPFGMLGALSSKEARQGLGVLMELTKAMGSLKNGGNRAVEQAEPIA